MAIINGTNAGDFLTGTNDGDTIFGFNGDDTIIGGRGNDFAILGKGNDFFVWNPGDGSDTVLGEAGFDTLEFHGANIAEQFEIRADGANAQMTRNVAAITMALDSVERIDLATLGGADIVHVGDMSGSKTTQVAIDLADFSGQGDGAADTVIADGRDKNDSIHITADGFGIAVSGLAASVTVANAESGDMLVVNGLGGNDTIDASGMQAATVRLTLDGGTGNDKITGGEGDDVIFGGEGNDTVVGGHGNDVAFLGEGDDKFTWSTGDGNDTVEGQGGVDTVRFNGADADETIQVFANGGRVLLTDSLDSVTLDINQVEKLDIRAEKGADTIVIGDLTGTGVTNVAVDLGSDADADKVTVQGTLDADSIKVTSSGSTVTVSGLSAEVTLTHVGAADSLTINADRGDDIIDASKLGANKLHLTINGGAGNDTITGSAGDDIVNGGQGNDTALLGAGNDRFTWNPGDGSDTVNGQAGFDTLGFNGANIAEQIGITANGSHVQFTRNVAAITMDLEQMERIEFRALGGADTITIGDLTGTGVKQIALDLGGSTGGGDGAADTVLADFSNAKDVIKLTQGADGVLTVASAAETITIANAEAGDALVVRALGGNDTLDASTLKDGVMSLTLDGGAGNDLIFGSEGADTLLGGDGNDTVTGGKGADTVMLGIGNDSFTWSIGDGNDVIDGGDGIDTLALNGSTGDDQIQVFGGLNGKLAVLGGAEQLDVSNMEQVRIDAKDGADTVTVGDLSATNVDSVTIDLGAGKACGTGDGKLDTVFVQTGIAGEVMTIANQGHQTVITNATTFQTIEIDNADATDVLRIQGSGIGNDVIMAAGYSGMSLQIFAGGGNDTIFSGAGDDLISGGQGSDVVLMGAGNDRFLWNPGDGSDSVNGEAGFDTLAFNGSNIGEEINILADGKNAEMTRNVAAIDMHLANMERIEFQALAGADTIHVHDLGGTTVKQVAIDLAAFTGDGDGAFDTVTVDGTAGNDHVTIASNNGVVTMTGLPAQVTVSHGELDDQISVNGGDGNDTIDASGVQSGNSHMTLDGGAGNDTISGGHDGDLIFGGDGHDVLKGGDGADTIDGGQGDDTIFGGAGDDVLGGGDGADTFVTTGLLDGHDLIEGFTSEDRLDLTKLFDNLGVAAGDREGRVSLTDNGFGDVNVAVDADGNTANGFEHIVATIHTNSPITVGHEVVVNG
jgi:Ca2+-binding RTX toxin-like protein